MVADPVELVDVGPGKIFLIKRFPVKNLVSQIERLFQLKTVFDSFNQEPVAFDIDRHLRLELP
jgi:hypothetical protein